MGFQPGNTRELKADELWSYELPGDRVIAPLCGITQDHLLHHKIAYNMQYFPPLYACVIDGSSADLFEW